MKTIKIKYAGIGWQTETGWVREYSDGSIIFNRGLGNQILHAGNWEYIK